MARTLGAPTRFTTAVSALVSMLGILWQAGLPGPVLLLAALPVAFPLIRELWKEPVNRPRRRGRRSSVERAERALTVTSDGPRALTDTGPSHGLPGTGVRRPCDSTGVAATRDPL